jgi:hypothetical protein
VAVALPASATEQAIKSAVAAGNAAFITHLLWFGVPAIVTRRRRSPRVAPEG